MAAEYNYQELARSIGQLVEEKQAAYGDSFGKSGNCLREMFPNGVKPEQLDMVLTFARILDKMFRLATDPTAFDECPWQDMAGYCLLKVKEWEDGEPRKGNL